MLYFIIITILIILIFLAIKYFISQKKKVDLSKFIPNNDNIAFYNNDMYINKRTDLPWDETIPCTNKSLVSNIVEPKEIKNIVSDDVKPTVYTSSDITIANDIITVPKIILY